MSDLVCPLAAPRSPRPARCADADIEIAMLGLVTEFNVSINKVHDLLVYVLRHAAGIELPTRKRKGVDVVVGIPSSSSVQSQQKAMGVLGEQLMARDLCDQVAAGVPLNAQLDGGCTGGHHIEAGVVQGHLVYHEPTDGKGNAEGDLCTSAFNSPFLARAQPSRARAAAQVARAAHA